MNELSSRSHLIMTLTVNRFDERDLSMTTAKLNMVDLAGSERVKDSGVSGEQLREAGYINKSLFTLASVVDSLQQTKTKKKVNYRDSKLTMLLQDSLGGNCKTTMLAMLSPSFDFHLESNCTLKFAHSCKQILNVARRNRYANSIPKSMPVIRKPKEVALDLPWKKVSVVQEEVKLKS